MKKLIVVTSICATVCATNVLSVNAQESNTLKTRNLISKSAEAYLDTTEKNLDTFLETNKDNIDSKDINKFFDSQKEVSPEQLQAIQDKSEKETSLLKKIGKSDQEIADSLVEKEYKLDNQNITLYKNGIYSIEEKDDNYLDTEENTYPQTFSTLAKSSKKTQYGENTKSYYSIAKIKLFTVSVSAKFYYNGTKATYRSGLDGYSKRGTLSLWQVNGFKVAKESDGSSYVATASGNFSYGFSYNGVGFNIKDVYIKHEVRCTKNGYIKKDYVFR